MGRKRNYLRKKKELKKERRIMKKTVNVFKSRQWYSKLKFLCDTRVPLIERKIKELEQMKKPMNF